MFNLMAKDTFPWTLHRTRITGSTGSSGCLLCKLKGWNGGKVPPKQVHQAIYCVIPACEPGSSLLETTTQPQNKPHQTQTTHVIRVPYPFHLFNPQKAAPKKQAFPGREGLSVMDGIGVSFNTFRPCRDWALERELRVP